MNPSPKLLDRVRPKIRYKHYSIRTEQVYVDWIKCFILIPPQAPSLRDGRSGSRTILSEL